MSPLRWSEAMAALILPCCSPGYALQVPYLAPLEKALDLPHTWLYSFFCCLISFRYLGPSLPSCPLASSVWSVVGSPGRIPVVIPCLFLHELMSFHSHLLDWVQVFDPLGYFPEGAKMTPQQLAKVFFS